MCNTGLHTTSYIIHAQNVIKLEDRSQTSIQVKITSMLGSKLDEGANGFRPVKFNISANLEELKRGANSVSMKFVFTIVTDPRTVKYQVDGTAELEGQVEYIKKMLAPHPSTRVPMVLYDIYGQVYASIFVLSKTVDAPCPSPELLSTSPVAPSSEQEVRQEEVRQEEARQEPAEPVVRQEPAEQTAESIVPEEKISA